MKARNTGTTRAYVAIFVFVAIVIAAAAFSYHSHQKAYLKARALEELTAIADLKVRELTVWRRERIADAMTLSLNPLTARAVREWLARPENVRLRADVTSVMEVFRQIYGYRDILLLDPSGGVRLSVPEGAGISPDVLARALQSREKGVMFFDLHRAGETGEIILTLVSRASNAHRSQRSRLGFLVLAMDPAKYLFPSIQDWPTPSPTGETLLVEVQGDEVVYLNELRHRKGTALTLRRPVAEASLPAARAARERAGTMEGIDYRGEPVLAAYRPVPDSPWVLVTKVDLREVYAPLRKSATLLTSLAAALIVTAGTLLMLLAGRQTERLHRREKLALEERDRARTELLEAERRSAAATRESEERFRTLADNMSQLAWMADETGSIFWYNKRWYDYTGTSFEQMQGWGWKKVHHPEHVERVVEKISQCFVTGEVWEDTFPLRGSDGDYRWFLSRAIPIRDESGRVVRWFGTNTDVTELREAEERLSEREKQLKVTFEYAPIGIEMLDLQGRYIRGNPWLARILGYREEELLNLTFMAITEPDDLRIELPLLQRLLAGEIPTYAVEKRYIGKDGRHIWARVTSSISWTDKPHRIAIIEDITERRHAEERLRQSEEQFRQLAETLPQLVWMNRPDGFVEYFNRRWYEYTGSTEEASQGERWPQFLHPDDYQRTLDRWKLSVETEELYEIEYRLRGADGGYRWFLARGLPVRDGEGRIVRWFGTCTDIEDQRRAREAAEAAARAKSDFMANMSHEIRTPMNGVLGVTDLLLDTELTVVQRQYLEMVKSSGEALLTVINDVLDFSKLEAGAMVLDSVEFDLRETVDNVGEILAVSAHRKGLELSVIVEPDLPDFFIGDPVRLRQVLMNLLGNAVKFTDEGEVVAKVEGSPAEGTERWRLLFSVSDTGIGIPQDKLEMLFQSFTQVDTSMTRSYGGTGLGLAIAKKLVEQMGGRIWVESRKGAGSTFSFEVELPAGEGIVKEEPGTPGELAGLRVLVLDDNATNREFLERALSARGMVAEPASRGEEGVRKVLEAAEAGKPYDLALIDLHMPDMDGFRVAEKLREHFPIGDLAIMMITSDDVSGGVQRAREMGMAAYVVKPVRVAALMETMLRVRSLRRAETAVLTGVQEPAEPPPSIPLCTQVLVVEDNPVNLTVAEAMLRKAGAKVTAATNGIEALDAMEAGTFDVVLMDVQMPEMDGFEATKRIREKGSDVPIIGLTAHALAGDRERCLAEGMDDYLPKPITAEGLSARVSFWARQRRHPAAKPETLLEQMGGDTEAANAIFETFRIHAPTQLAELRAAVEDMDAAHIDKAAHRLKGALFVVKADTAACLAEELEKAGKKGDLSHAQAFLEQLEAEMARVMEQVGTDR
jgi:two-component system, sensor histidine kinase and response regulator